MRRVIKIGGSLLLRPNLVKTLERWLQSQPNAETICIVGGGKLIDAMRQLDAVYASSPPKLHWQCVDLLQITFEWLGHQLDGWTLLNNQGQFESFRDSTGNAPESGESNPNRFLVNVSSFYHPLVDTPLPEDWSTTTDAIAGWLAITLKADELVLLKSCDCDQTLSLTELAHEGVIDGALPLLSDHLPPVRCVNFLGEIDS